MKTSTALNHVHLIGIGGAGMSGIARIMLQRGYTVSGSDLRDGRSLDELRALGATIAIGHDPANISQPDRVVVSSAVPHDNPERQQAEKQGIPVLLRAQMLAELAGDDVSVFVAGTHGKTTTTSMTIVALHAAGHDPSFSVGGALNEAGTNAHAGQDPLFIAEADESDRSFLFYRPRIAVLTNLELDHPEEFTSLEDVIGAFVEFVRPQPEPPAVALCLDDPVLRGELLPYLETLGADVLTYGTDPSARLRALIDPHDQDVRVVFDGEDLPQMSLSVPGRHNIVNALGALAACHLVGADLKDAMAGLAQFTGAARRFQFVGEAAGVSVIDDYAHHPTELRATLSAARMRYPDSRVVVVVQPHRYSRTTVFGAELGRAAAAADVVLVTDVYGAGEAAILGVAGALVADAAEASGAKVTYVPRLSDLPAALFATVTDGDVVITAGAGDVTTVGPTLLDLLRTARP
ncbi:MAG: UDP-N-acetylmuramate--L-alanine ligase [Nitriliruptoraceae bacterium]